MLLELNPSRSSIYLFIYLLLHDMAAITITTEIIGLSLGLATPVGAGLWWFFGYYKNLIEENLRREFRHEIDRIVTEQNHLFCFMEDNASGYQRLQISGEYRGVFFQSCDNSNMRRPNDW